MTDDEFEGNKHPFCITRNHAWFLDDLDLSDEATVGSIDFDQMGTTDAGFFDELEPMCSGTVQGLAFSGNQRWNDLVEHGDLVGESEFKEIRIVRAPDLLHFALIQHFAHVDLVEDSGSSTFAEVIR